MATTNFTKLKVATQEQIEIFAEVDIADHKITGTCVMFNDLSYYKSCNKHLSRLSDDGCCSDCGHIGKDDGKVDFRCSLIIEDCDDDTMVAVVIFKRHLELNLCYDDDEDKLIQGLEDNVIGKKCQIYYNDPGGENNVAIRVKIIE